MSDDYAGDDENENGPEDEQPEEPQPDRNPLRSVNRRLEKELKTLRAEAAANKGAARELAFMKAGLDLEAPGAKSFVKGYDGALDKEAILAAAAEDNLTVPSAEDVISPEEKAAHGRLAGAPQGTPPSVPDFDSLIAEAKAAGQMQRAIALKQEQAAVARAKA